MITIDRSTIKFLYDLNRHNDRLWFAENRSRYETARENFSQFVQAVIDDIVRYDPIFRGLEAKSCIYRINRDIRFTHDKTIYKTNFGALLSAAERRMPTDFPVITFI